jgi:hypothetical protein
MQWIWSAFLGGLALVVIVTNWMVLVRNVAGRGTAGSGIPFVGGVLGCLALFSAPYDALRAWWWVPFFIDWGSIPSTLVATWQSRPRRK